MDCSLSSLNSWVLVRKTTIFCVSTISWKFRMGLLEFLLKSSIFLNPIRSISFSSVLHSGSVLFVKRYLKCNIQLDTMIHHRPASHTGRSIGKPVFLKIILSISSLTYRTSSCYCHPLSLMCPLSWVWRGTELKLVTDRSNKVFQQRQNICRSCEFCFKWWDLVKKKTEI